MNVLEIINWNNTIQVNLNASPSLSFRHNYVKMTRGRKCDGRGCGARQSASPRWNLLMVTLLSLLLGIY